MRHRGAPGDTVPGNGLPAIDSAFQLTPASAAIMPDETEWSPFGGWSGTCFDVGCGYTGWVAMSYTFTTAGSYVLEVGVVNWSDGNHDSGLAFAGNLVPVPEPQTYAMMLAGLGVLAWAARRRRDRV
jgi:predicted cobalt transporter CbtA